MSDTELDLARLLCTRLSHDLAGPIGAVAAGVELMGDDPAAIDAEILDLIGKSSVAASHKLKFLRAAFGVAGGAPLDLKNLLDGYLEAVAGPAGRVALVWPAPAATAAVSEALGSHWGQAALNLCLLGLEMQPGCRALAVRCADRPPTITVEVRGAGDQPTAVRDDLKAAADGPAHPLTAKTIQAHMAGSLIRAAGGTMEWSAAGDHIQISAVFRAARASAAAGE